MLLLGQKPAYSRKACCAYLFVSTVPPSSLCVLIVHYSKYRWILPARAFLLLQPCDITRVTMRGRMREKVSTLRLDALSKNGRAYAAAVAVIVALFLLLTVSFQGSDSTQLTGIPSRFLFSTGAFSSPPSVTLSLSVQCSLSEWVSRTQQGFHLTRSNSVAIAHSLPVVAFHVYVCGAYGSGKQLASCKHPQVRVLLEKVTTSQDARSAETMQKRYTLSATCIILSGCQCLLGAHYCF